MAPAEPSTKDATGRVGRGFISLYVLAQVGAFTAFIPMLNVLLPLKAAEISPESRLVTLSQVALWGALAAAGANLAVGLLSDATKGGWGRRRPWIGAGVAAVVVAHGLVFSARSAAELICAFVALQIAVNMVFSPLNAVLPERVQTSQRGQVAAWAGLALPAATLIAAAVALLDDWSLASRFALAALAVAGLVSPFVIDVHEPMTPIVRARRLSPLIALADRDFSLAFCVRLLVQLAITLNTLFLLYYLQDVMKPASAGLAESPEAVLGWLMAALTLASVPAGFAAGLLSDRLGRRRVFVAAGGLLMAIGAAVMAVAPAWPGPLLAQLAFGLGLGIFTTVDLALVAEVLPDPRAAGRDLGVMNLAITAPQVLAPLVALFVISLSDEGLRWIFAIAGASAALGALIVPAIRRVR